MSEIWRTEETNISTINYTVPITDELIEYILCSAFEGGSTYWLRWANIENKKDAKKVACFTSEYLTRTNLKDAKLIIWTVDDSKIPITKKSIIDALQKMDDPKNGCTEALGRILDETYDADDADIAVQMACFGEVVYG